MVIDFGDGMEFEATFNGFTPIVFSRTFSVEKPNGATRPKDINEDVGMIVETMKSCGMPSMTALLEIAYACIKTAKPRWGLGFDKWVKSLPPAAFDLQKGDASNAGFPSPICSNLASGRSKTCWRFTRSTPMPSPTTKTTKRHARPKRHFGASERFTAPHPRGRGV